jgi:hypothetical protein
VEVELEGERALDAIDDPEGLLHALSRHRPEFLRIDVIVRLLLGS